MIDIKEMDLTDEFEVPYMLYDTLFPFKDPPTIYANYLFTYR